jgi:soluble lytic murein transglycosylase-like protein
MRYLTVLSLLVCVLFVGCPKQPLLSEQCSASNPRLASAKNNGIPNLAYSLQPQLTREIHFYWGKNIKTTTFFSQVHQESGWNPEAKSKYASGLAQFTPSTAEWISHLYPKDLGEGNPLDSKWALRALVRYDKWLFDRFSYADQETDRWSFTLSGYNGGAGWVEKDRKLATLNGRSDRKWICNVEHFSNRAGWAIKENRDYIVKILFKWFTFYEKGGFR